MIRAERRWVRAILRGFSGSDTGLTPERGEVDWLGTFEAMRRGSNRLAAVGLRLALWLVAFAPWWALRRARTFRGLAEGERAPLLARLLDHRWYVVRELTLLLKVAASTALLGSPSVRARSDYDPVDPPAALEASA